MAGVIRVLSTNSSAMDVMILSWRGRFGRLKMEGDARTDHGLRDAVVDRGTDKDRDLGPALCLGLGLGALPGAGCVLVWVWDCVTAELPDENQPNSRTGLSAV